MDSICTINVYRVLHFVIQKATINRNKQFILGWLVCVFIKCDQEHKLNKRERWTLKQIEKNNIVSEAICRWICVRLSVLRNMSQVSYLPVDCWSHKINSGLFHINASSFKFITANNTHLLSHFTHFNSSPTVTIRWHSFRTLRSEKKPGQQSQKETSCARFMV